MRNGEKREDGSYTLVTCSLSLLSHIAITISHEQPMTSLIFRLLSAVSHLAPLRSPVCLHLVNIADGISLPLVLASAVAHDVSFGVALPDINLEVDFSESAFSDARDGTGFGS